MILKLKTYLKKILPEPITLYLRLLAIIIRKITLRIKIKQAESKHRVALQKILGKEKNKIAFLLINVDSWKYDSLYFEFFSNDRFDPVVIICPFTSKGDSFMKAQLQRSIEFCKERGYNFYVAYSNNKTVDIKKILNLDIVFFSNPNNLTEKKLLIGNFSDVLTCYLPYSFRISNFYTYEYDADLLNLVWIQYCETSIHKKISEQFSKNKGRNVVVSGYPHFERLCLKMQQEEKKLIVRKKKIIWAPHWTIKGFQDTGLDWACFLDYCSLFLEIADSYATKIDFVMKPHPFLKIILEDSVWGRDKTNCYFKMWEDKKNCQIVEGDYTDLFVESDALIHDSGSFMAEYLMVNKPIAYTVNCRNYLDRFNQFGKIVIDCHEIVTCEEELFAFIERVANGEDLLEKQRDAVLSKHLSVNDGRPSQNIVKDIIRKIDGQ